jgi:hypothetical protein
MKADEKGTTPSAPTGTSADTLASYSVPVGSGGQLSWDEPDEVLRKLDEKLEPRIQALRDSERLSEEDYAITINVRD